MNTSDDIIDYDSADVRRRVERSEERELDKTTPAERTLAISGHNSQQVMDLIRARARSGSRADGHRLALAVEGGAMRGVYTAGSLLALHIMGMWNLFDNAYGSSAGAVNIAQFLSGVGHTKADTYYRFLTDRRFINSFRLNKIVDIDFFFNTVLTDLRPIEVDRVMNSVTPLWVAVADFVTAQPMLLHAQAGTYPLPAILKAASALPVLYNKLVDLSAIQGFDAGFINPIPLDAAFAHGSTHILVLLPHSESYVLPARLWLEEFGVNLVFARKNRKVRQLYRACTATNNRLRDLAHGRTAPPADTAIATLAPASERRPVIGQKTQNPKVLRSELICAARDTLRFFNYPEDELDKYIREGKL